MRLRFSGACILLISLLPAIPAMAQRGVSGDGGGGRTATTGSVSTSTVTPSTESSSPAAYSYPSPSGGMGNRAFTFNNGSAASRYVLSLERTSFNSEPAYYSWSRYYDFLATKYYFDNLYFIRFMRNREPLITPTMLRYTVVEPLAMSRRMLLDFDQLETLLKEPTANKTAIAEKSQHIRKLAKAIRQDRTIGLIDIRAESEIPGSEIADALSPDAIAKLRELALDINRQLTQLYSAPSTATISVENYKEASFESMAKGIERVCKAIERSSKRL